MRIYRTEQQLKNCEKRDKWTVIRLSEQEMIDAYYEQQRDFRIADIVDNIDERIADAEMQNAFSSGWSSDVAKECIKGLEELIDDNDNYYEDYADMVDYYVRKTLKELGIDPKTMKKENELNDETA